MMMKNLRVVVVVGEKHVVDAATAVGEAEVGIGGGRALTFQIAEVTQDRVCLPVRGVTVAVAAPAGVEAIATLPKTKTATGAAVVAAVVEAQIVALTTADGKEATVQAEALAEVTAAVAVAVAAVVETVQLGHAAAVPAIHTAGRTEAEAETEAEAAAAATNGVRPGAVIVKAEETPEAARVGAAVRV